MLRNRMKLLRLALVVPVCVAVPVLGETRPDVFSRLRSVPEFFTGMPAGIWIAAAAAALLLLNIVWRKGGRRVEKDDAVERRIVDSLRIPVVFYDSAGTPVRLNRAAEALAEEAGREKLLRFPGKEECSGDGGEYEGETTLGGRDYQESVYPVRTEDGFAGTLKTLTDISEEKALQRRLNLALTEARNSERAKTLFLATMSHELRTPLNTIIGFCELLRDNPGPSEDLDESIDAIRLAGNTLLKLINDVLDLSKIDAREMKIVPEPTNPVQLAREMRALFRQKTDRQNLYYEVICPEDLPALMLDGLRIRQILLNLIGNAVKFTLHGQVIVTLSFRETGDGEGTFEAEVSDTGVGVAPESRETIFDPFVQQDATRDSLLFHGTGLGLAISRRLARCMNGDITLDSTVGQGSTFRLILEGVKKAAPVESPAAISVGSPDSKPLHILLVDDVPLNAKVLAAMLKKLGAEAVTVSNGAEALDLLVDDVPDALLTDMWMPEMNGEELAARVRAIPALAGVAVIAVTADTDSRNNFNLEHFNGVLTKPVTLEKLKKLLAWLHHSRHTPSASPVNFD